MNRNEPCYCGSGKKYKACCMRSEHAEPTNARAAEFWHARDGGRVVCDLCYRRCEIADGGQGFCKIRENQHGKMILTAHGILAQYMRTKNGYALDSFMTFKPGTKSVMLGGISCTSRCSFCSSGQIALAPDKVAWLAGFEKKPLPTGSTWASALGMYAPSQVILTAQNWGAQQITFAINEPTLTIEYTLDVARLAKRAGLRVGVLTNGFTGQSAIEQLAPHVDAVNIGIKGSASADFYARYMRADGATPHVLKSAQAWKAAGVYLMVSDIIAAPHLQDDATREDAQKYLYGWIARELGDKTPVMLGAMGNPKANTAGAFANLLLMKSGADQADIQDARERVYKSLEVARAMGLAYSWVKIANAEFKCHACGATLLKFDQAWSCKSCVMSMRYCTKRTHEQHVTQGRCDACGANVPIVV